MIDRHQSIPDSNCVHVRYSRLQDARRAVAHSGETFGQYVLGFMPCNQDLVCDVMLMWCHDVGYGAINGTSTVWDRYLMCVIYRTHHVSGDVKEIPTSFSWVSRLWEYLTNWWWLTVHCVFQYMYHTWHDMRWSYDVTIDNSTRMSMSYWLPPLPSLHTWWSNQATTLYECTFMYMWTLPL